ncbi:hypothetical protein QP794_28210 [Paenibacillus sp. UMB7766-LJ446]|nr:hypothetical protein [Paenibacillus sp. UMB7766-LJ446]
MDGVNMLSKKYKNKPNKNKRPLNKFESFRKGLERNKIFFEVLVTLSLSTMALFVSCQANTIASNQTAIAEAENMPVFEIKSTQVYDDDRKEYTEHKVKIANEGGPIYGFDSDVVTFLNIDYLDNKDGYINKNIRVPLRGYFTASLVTSKVKGELATVQGYLNNNKLFDLTQEILNGPDAEEKFIDIEIQVYVKIRYEDFLHRYNEEYYYVPYLQTQKLSQSEGENIFKEHSEALLSKGVEFLDLSRNKVIKIINEVNEDE